ncbi:MAG: methyltransferase domain-containing protein [Gemmatimonadetes bacterium]|nr:methyltransferase domain-containing protein [Gemmatimonadota bacterium]
MATVMDATLEAKLFDAVLEMYRDVATQPDKEYHFHTGRTAALRLGYPAEIVDRLPVGAVESFAGVGNPHRTAGYREGETVVDVGSGAGLDVLLAAHAVGPRGRVIGVDLNQVMLEKARANARAAGAANVDFREGRMEQLPVEDGTAQLVISNGVVNLAMRKKVVLQELYRVLAPAGRLSLTDIVSEREIAENVRKDPKLWAA